MSAMVISTRDLPDGATMAHVAVLVGIFPSLTQARKNGWDRPIELGEQFLSKKRIHVNIVDRPIAENDAKPRELTRERPDLEPGFWNEWTPPATNVAWAIQFPMHDKNFAERMVNAFAKDAADARRNKPVAE